LVIKSRSMTVLLLVKDWKISPMNYIIRTTAKEQAEFFLSTQNTIWLISSTMLVLVILTLINWGNIDDL